MPGSNQQICSFAVEGEWREVSVHSSTRDVEYIVVLSPWGDAACDCAGYHFKGHCRHIDSVKSHICDWHEDMMPEQTIDQMQDHLCPKCGGETWLFVR